jgi:hypothetical protein
VVLDTPTLSQYRYTNALIIQSRGHMPSRLCAQCRASADRSDDGFPSPFPVCVAATAWDGCCGNCKWRDHGQACSFNFKG